MQQNKDDKVKDVAAKENMKQAAASHCTSEAGNGSKARRSCIEDQKEPDKGGTHIVF